MALTKRAIDAASFDSSASQWQVLWDDQIPGLGVRLSRGGAKTFVVSYRPRGSRRKRVVSLGRYGVLTLAQARERARRLLVDVADGKDPAEERRREEATTLSEFARTYLERHAKPNKRTWQEDVRRLEGRILPALGTLTLADIRPGDVAAFHAEIGREGARVEANRCVELLRTMLNKAIRWGYLDEDHRNPADRVDRFRERSRDRFVTPEEAPRLLAAIDEEEDPYVRAYFRLLLLTGCRKKELLTARWADVDQGRRILRIPDPKNRETREVPLPPEAMALLAEVPRQLGNPHIVCSSAKPGAHLVNVAKPWRRIRARAELDDVRIHDLRRTVGSWLAMSGASLPLIGEVLGHKSPASTKVYARFQPGAARGALEEHATRLAAVAGLESR